MPKLVAQLKLKGNPFQYYTAETEPNISEYAIKPPYMESITHRALSSTSFILFGDRGAGKSATRITVFEEIWKRKSKENETQEKAPLAVNLTDFSRVIAAIESKKDVEQAFVEEIAFVIIEQILVWLSSLSEEDRNTYLGALDDSEKALIVDAVRIFYLSRPEAERGVRSEEALKILNQAWTTRAQLWIGRRWNELVSVIAATAETIVSYKTGQTAKLAKPIEDILQSKDITSAMASRVTLRKLVDVARTFSFSGIVVLIDKVDETLYTQNSAEKTSRLIYPVLSHIQLLEIEGFSWMFFLWTKIKPYFEAGPNQVRLDKIAHTTIAWDVPYFEQMLDERIRYFSDKRFGFDSLFLVQDLKQIKIEIIETAMRSPRELIRLLDTIVTEHDIMYADNQENVLLDQKSIETGMDRYVQDTVNSVYDEKMLTQVYRLSSTKFTNKDIQRIFRIIPNSARNKIRTWEDVGIVKQTGTRAAEGDSGGKPSNEYTIIDSRVARIVARNLVEIDEDFTPDEEQDEDPSGSNDVSAPIE